VIFDLPAFPEGPPTLAPPAILSPAPREASFGLVRGHVARGTTRIVVSAGRLRLADVPHAPESRRFRLRVSLPARDLTLRVTAFNSSGGRASASVGPVLGLPPASAARRVRSVEDRWLARRLRALVAAHGSVAAFYVQDLRTGRGAAWNARARFPAASTLKLAIAVEVLRALESRPRPGTRVDVLLRRMLQGSDNAAANNLEVWLGGSISAGAARVNATMRAVGLADSHIFGGYALGTTTRRRIPLTIESQPSFGLGKYTTAWDLARLHTFVHLAAAGRGPLARLKGSFTRADARFLLYSLAHVRDPGKLDRFVRGRGAIVAHKAGWITTARHDAGLVYWRDGAFVASVLTWRPAGAGAGADILAGRLALTALRRFRAAEPSVPRVPPVAPVLFRL
jgi:beta-lactamase class A